MADGNKPVHTIQIGYIKATIWKNGNHYNTTISRSFKDEKGNWQEVDSFGLGDLPTIAKVADMACNWIASQ